MKPSTPQQKENLEILIVDDDKIVRLLHRRNLEKLTALYPISEYPNGQNALEYLQQKKNSGKQFLILLDINMPVMNGWQFLQECNNNLQSQNLYTVLLSSSTTKQDKEKARRFPQVIEFLEKPFLRKTALGLTALHEIGHFFSRQKISDMEINFEA